MYDSFRILIDVVVNDAFPSLAHSPAGVVELFWWKYQQDLRDL